MLNSRRLSDRPGGWLSLSYTKRPNAEDALALAGSVAPGSNGEPGEPTGSSNYQDLVEQNGFKNSYQSVQRFVRKLKRLEPQRIWRMEARPGEEVQVDFGLGAPICEGSSRPRRSWVFRMVLSYSRKAYSEAVVRQDTETFLRCLENGLRAFGGCRCC